MLFVASPAFCGPDIAVLAISYLFSQAYAAANNRALEAETKNRAIEAETKNRALEEEILHLKDSFAELKSLQPLIRSQAKCVGLSLTCATVVPNIFFLLAGASAKKGTSKPATHVETGA